jgi:Domain of unknown function (DUF4352)
MLTVIRTMPQRRIGALLHAGLHLALLLALATCSRSPTTQQTYAAGQTAEVDGWKITVHGLFRLEGDEWHQPADGHVFCAVELTLENTSGHIRYVMPEKQMRLLDAVNHTYAAGRDAGVMAARSRQWYVPQGEVGVGKVLHGAAAYEIPTGSQGLRWTFRTGLLPWSKTVVFALGDMPSE